MRNFAARSNLQAMKKGDHAFFYHTGDEKQVVGIAEIIREAYKDPTDEKGVFVCVDTKAVAPFPKPVTLAAIKAEPKLKSMVLVREPRLSVQPVTDEEWKLHLQDGRGEGVVARLARSPPPCPSKTGVNAPVGRGRGWGRRIRKTRATPTPPFARSRRPSPQGREESYAAMLATTCASSCSRCAGERRPFSPSENFSSLPFSNAATTVWCT